MLIMFCSVEVDEEELDAELEALGEEMEMGGWEAEGSSTLPSFLEEPTGAVPDFLDEGPTKMKETAQ